MLNLYNTFKYSRSLKKYLNLLLSNTVQLIVLDWFWLVTAYCKHLCSQVSIFSSPRVKEM